MIQLKTPEQIEIMKNFYPFVSVEKYVIMPNHIHFLFQVKEPNSNILYDLFIIYSSTTNEKVLPYLENKHIKIWLNSQSLPVDPLVCLW